MKRMIGMRDFVLLNLGTFLVAASVYFFKFPNHFSSGGVTGLSVVLTHFLPTLSAGRFTFIINLVFLLFGFIFINKSFGFKTIYSTVLLSVLLLLFEWLFPMTAPLTGQTFLELIYLIGLQSLGLAILFTIDASSGGTDILAMILRKYTQLDISKALFVSDVVVVLLAGVAFGVETMLMSVFALVVSSYAVGSFMEAMNRKKEFTIITNKPAEISAFINHKLGKGATLWHATGTFTDEKRTVLLTTLYSPQARLLKAFVRDNDPQAFLMISNTSEVIGIGFRQV